MRKLLIFLIMLMLTFSLGMTGCGSIVDAIEERQEETKDQDVDEKDNDEVGEEEEDEEADDDTSDADQTEDASEETSETTEAASDKDNAVTPYQFLNLMVGNAEIISCQYAITQAYDNREDTATYYRNGDLTSVVFTTYGLNTDTMMVREVERDGMVYYVIDESQSVMSYLAPSHDILMNEMMQVLTGDVLDSYAEGNTMVYEYSKPFAQDETIDIHYHFFMENNMLSKLEILFRDELQTTYEFSDFSMNAFDETVFDIPAEYTLTEHEYEFYEDSLPPWWEVESQE